MFPPPTPGCPICTGSFEHIELTRQELDIVGKTDIYMIGTEATTGVTHFFFFFFLVCVC